jgi:hypothetical protein
VMSTTRSVISVISTSPSVDARLWSLKHQEASGVVDPHEAERYLLRALDSQPR